MLAIRFLCSFRALTTAKSVLLKKVFSLWFGFKLYEQLNVIGLSAIATMNNVSGVIKLAW